MSPCINAKEGRMPACLNLSVEYIPWDTLSRKKFNIEGDEEGRGWHRNANEKGWWMKVSRTLQGHSCFSLKRYIWLKKHA